MQNSTSDIAASREKNNEKLFSGNSILVSMKISRRTKKSTEKKREKKRRRKWKKTKKGWRRLSGVWATNYEFKERKLGKRKHSCRCQPCYTCRGTGLNKIKGVTSQGYDASRFSFIMLSQVVIKQLSPTVAEWGNWANCKDALALFCHRFSVLQTRLHSLLLPYYSSTKLSIIPKSHFSFLRNCKLHFKCQPLLCQNIFWTLWFSYLHHFLLITKSKNLQIFKFTKNKCFMLFDIFYTSFIENIFLSDFIIGLKYEVLLLVSMFL